jgi:ribosomal protein L31E
VCNQLLKLLVTEKHILDNACNKTLAKKKSDREAQLKEFVDLDKAATERSPEGLKCLRQFLGRNCKQRVVVAPSAEQRVYKSYRMTLDLKARVTMLAVDPNSVLILDRIYAGATKEQRRQALDDKS